MIDLSQEFRAPDDVMFRDLGGEAVLLNVSTGRYFGLDEMATRMWSLINSERCLAQVVDDLVEEYEVDRATVTDDLVGLVRELVEHSLLLPVGAARVESEESSVESGVKG